MFFPLFYYTLRLRFQFLSYQLPDKAIWALYSFILYMLAFSLLPPINHFHLMSILLVFSNFLSVRLTRPT